MITDTRLMVVLCLVTAVASAEIRRSSRNLKPLTEQQRERSMMGGGSMTGNKGGKTTVAPATETPPPESRKVVKVVYQGPESGWGFLTARSPYYSPEGKNLGKLPAGTLFKFNGKKETATSTYLIATCKTEAGTWSAPCLVDCQKISIYEGDPETVDPAMVEKLGRFHTLTGQIADRKEELETEANKKNPHLAAARAASQKYQATLDQATKLETEMNAATGIRRSKLQDQLRALKYEQAKIKSQADEATKAYRTWKAAHPIDPSLFDNDPQLKELEAKRAATGVKAK